MNLLLKLGIILAILLASLTGKGVGKSDRVYNLYSGDEGIVTRFSHSAKNKFDL